MSNVYESRLSPVSDSSPSSPHSPSVEKTGAKRKKKDGDLPPDERRRKQNREAAQKCRERKRALIDQLEAQVKALFNEKKTLEDQVRTLSAENRVLFEKNKRLESVEAALKASFPKFIKPTDISQQRSAVSAPVPTSVPLVVPTPIMPVTAPLPTPVQGWINPESLPLPEDEFGDYLLDEEISFDFQETEMQPGVQSLQGRTFRANRGSVQPALIRQQQRLRQQLSAQRIMKQTSSQQQPDPMLQYDGVSQSPEQNQSEQRLRSSSSFRPVKQPKLQQQRSYDQQSEQLSSSVQQRQPALGLLQHDGGHQPRPLQQFDRLQYGEQKQQMIQQSQQNDRLQFASSYQDQAQSNQRLQFASQSQSQAQAQSQAVSQPQPLFSPTVTQAQQAASQPQPIQFGHQLQQIQDSAATQAPASQAQAAPGQPQHHHQSQSSSVSAQQLDGHAQPSSQTQTVSSADSHAGQLATAANSAVAPATDATSSRSVHQPSPAQTASGDHQSRDRRDQSQLAVVRSVPSQSVTESVRASSLTAAQKASVIASVAALKQVNALQLLAAVVLAHETSSSSSFSCVSSSSLWCSSPSIVSSTCSMSLTSSNSVSVHTHSRMNQHCLPISVC